MASDDWADNALALLANGDREKALAVALSRLRRMPPEDSAWASGTLLLLSGILKMEHTVNERMKEAGMINLVENKVLAPLILQQYEKGRDEGKQEGKQEALLALLLDQITDKFGPLPEWAAQRLHSASAPELHAWAGGSSPAPISKRLCSSLPASHGPSLRRIPVSALSARR